MINGEAKILPHGNPKGESFPDNNSSLRPPFTLSGPHPVSHTKVLGHCAILSKDCHNSGFQDLQGGNVSRQDAKVAAQCGNVHLLHGGSVVQHLREGKGGWEQFSTLTAGGSTRQTSRVPHPILQLTG